MSILLLLSRAELDFAGLSGARSTFRPWSLLWAGSPGTCFVTMALGLVHISIRSAAICGARRPPGRFLHSLCGRDARIFRGSSPA